MKNVDGKTLFKGGATNTVWIATIPQVTVVADMGACAIGAKITVMAGRVCVR